MKIQITTSSFGDEGPKPLKHLENFNIKLKMNPFGRSLTEDEAIKVISDADGLIAGTEPLTEKVLKELPNLKVISRCGAGMDSVDLKAAERLGIKVINTPDVHVSSVAELALAGILCLYRNIPSGDTQIKNSKWIKTTGRSLFEKKIGLVGMGKVATKLALLLKPFNVELKGYDPFVKNTDIRMVKNLDEVLIESDIISIHVPYNKSTKHMLNDDNLRLLKHDALIVNTSRGGIIDEEALYKFLTANPASSAFLDVFNIEPYTGKLIELPNILLSPHVGARTKQTREEMEFQSAINLTNALFS